MSQNVKTILALLTTSIFISACSDKNKDTPVNNNTANSNISSNNSAQNNNSNNSQKQANTQQQTHAQLNQQAIEQNIKTKQASIEQSQTVIKQIYPRITIPKQPGNIKTLLTQMSNNSGYQLDWRLQGYYNLEEKNLQSFIGQPLGISLMSLENLMTFANKNLRLHWNLSNPGENFPYPLEVASIICGKTILIFEMDNKRILPQLLTQKEYATCSIPDGTFDITLPKGATAVDITQLDFSKPPPFVSSDSSGMIQMNVPNNTNPSKNDISWTTPTTGAQITISETEVANQVVKNNPQARLNPQTSNANKAMQGLK